MSLACDCPFSTVIILFWTLLNWRCLANSRWQYLTWCQKFGSEVLSNLIKNGCMYFDLTVEKLQLDDDEQEEYIV